MTPQQFAATRQQRWEELETCITTAQRHRMRAMDAAAIERFGLLYRHALSDLAIARRDFPQEGLTDYLNGLCARAHPLLHRGAPVRRGSLRRFYLTGLPRVFRASRDYVLASLLISLAGVAAGWLAMVLRSDIADSLYPRSPFEDMARGTLPANFDRASFVTSYIIQNNVRVALLCFAGGMLLGLPTALTLFGNGWVLGTLAEHIHGAGLDLQFWPYILPHGVIELSVIVFAGGSGLMVGDAVLRPGLLPRSDAVAAAARRAVVLACGVATLLVIAGCLEGFVSPSSLPGGVKALIGLGTGVLLYSWLLLAGRERAAAPAPSLDLTEAARIAAP